MTLAFTATDIKQNIDHDHAICSKLLQVLREEQEALKERDADTIDSLLSQKVPLLEALEKSAKLRQQWASSANINSDEAGWQEIINQLAPTSLKADWEALKVLYTSVSEQNELNGKLLSRHQSTVKRLLDLIRGNPSTPNLYSANGYSTSASQSNKFGEA